MTSTLENDFVYLCTFPTVKELNVAVLLSKNDDSIKNPPLHVDVGTVLTCIRVEHAMCLELVAERMGIHVNVVRKAETGLVSPEYLSLFDKFFNTNLLEERYTSAPRLN